MGGGRRESERERASERASERERARVRERGVWVWRSDEQALTWAGSCVGDYLLVYACV